MAQWPTGDLIANGIRIHYYRTGGDKPPVVLSHGFSGNSAWWVRVARDLAKDYDVVVYDHRGHGRSETPETGYTSEDRAADLAGLIDVLKLAQPRVAGCSMGAAAVASAAALYPNLLRCAVLEDPPWRDWGGSATPAQLEAMTERRRAEIFKWKSTPREELIARLRAENPNWPDEVIVPLAEAKQQTSVNNAQAFNMGARWQDTVRKITCPILLMTADPDKGCIVTPEAAQEAATLWRRGKLVHVANSGHNIHWDQYEHFMEALVPFFAEV
jgi:N-formylmaleamate deformylase